MAKSDSEFLAERTLVTDTCWLWQGSKSPNGYGQMMRVKGIKRLPHRVAYELACGTIPESLTVDHLCRNKLCVNPEHMELVTRAENTRRGQTDEFCAKGHVLEGNRYISPKGKRECDICRRDRMRSKKDVVIIAKMVDASTVDFSRKHADRWFQSDWLNGEAWMLVNGEDFSAKGETIRTRLYQEATAAGMAARVKILGNGDVLFQAYEPSDEERARKAAATEKRQATRAANANGNGEAKKSSKKSA